MTYVWSCALKVTPAGGASFSGSLAFAESLVSYGISPMPVGVGFASVFHYLAESEASVGGS